VQVMYLQPAASFRKSAVVLRWERPSETDFGSLAVYRAVRSSAEDPWLCVPTSQWVCFSEGCGV